MGSTYGAGGSGATGTLARVTVLVGNGRLAVVVLLVVLASVLVVVTTLVLVLVVLSVPSVVLAKETVVVVVSEASAVTIDAVASVGLLDVSSDGRQSERNSDEERSGLHDDGWWNMS